MEPDSNPAAMPDDRALVAGCLAGDRRAWTALLDRYDRLIYGVALRCGLNRQRADDVFQNVALILLRRLGQLREASNLAGWLVTVTRREVFREARRWEGADSDPEPLLARLADEGCSAEALVAEWERYRALHAALEEMGGRCERLLRRLYFAEPPPSYEEIAAELEIAVGTVGPARADCLKRLRALMRQRGD